MLRPLNYLITGTPLNHLTSIHDQRLLGEVAGAGEIMRDEEQCHVLFFFETQQQIQHIQSDGYVQHGDRLVGEENRRLCCQRAGNCDALTLAATKLVRKLLHELLGRGQVHSFEQRHDELRLFSSIMGIAMNA